ncbi:unnamed protein product [Urochloa humidicola]
MGMALCSQTVSSKPRARLVKWSASRLQGRPKSFSRYDLVPISSPTSNPFPCAGCWHPSTGRIGSTIVRSQQLPFLVYISDRSIPISIEEVGMQGPELSAQASP